jgi:hypothetical protein
VLGSAALALFSFQLKAMTDWRRPTFGLITLSVVYSLQDGTSHGLIGPNGPAAQLKNDPAVKAAYLGGSH